MANLIDQTVSHYRILEHLGGGGMGVVYKALDTKLDRFVALKFLPPDLTRDPDAKQRFIHEAKAASALDHQNICNIHDIGETDDGQIYIVMAFYQGETLKKRIERGPLKIDEAVDIAVQVAHGLATAHEHGIVHRDIKPANIVVTSDGVVKIVDFGLAKLSGRTMITRTGSTLGTAAYMSPEQARGEPTDHRTDIWSLGVVLYEMLAGKRPFEAEYENALLYSILNAEPRPVAALRADVPLSIETLVSKCLEKNVSARLTTIREFGETLDNFKRVTAAPSFPDFVSRAVRISKRPVIAVPAMLLLAGLMYGAYQLFNHSSKVKWARGEGVTEVARLADNDMPFSAFTLAKQVEEYIPENPLLLKTWPRFARYAIILSDPPGARVFIKEYLAPHQDWAYLGLTPLDSVRVPIGFLRLKFEKEGYTVLQVASSTAWFRPIFYRLDRPASLPPGMQRVPGGECKLRLSGAEHIEPVHVGDYLMDRYEVTNQEYKRFVDAAGYQQRAFWKEPFTKDGKLLTWEQAISEFKDRTGRPGPSTWEVGSYPEGQGGFPVAGISWYEAAAYAAYAGKSLPTIFHWDHAAEPRACSDIVPMSNFSGKTLDSVGKNQGLSPFGTFDMGGNVREWCWNASGAGRFILGGGWDDEAYMFTSAYAQSPFNRSRSNGVRCVRYEEGDTTLRGAMRAVTMPFRDFRTEQPVPDNVFKFFLPLFAYDRTDLQSRVESSDTTEEWIKQKITYNAAYGRERVAAYLFLPRVGKPPYQAVLYFPGSNAILESSSSLLQMSVIDFVIKSGRAVLYPVYKGTYERNSGITTDIPDTTNAYKEWIIQLEKDIGRSLDYLETRSDIDPEKFAYYGLSWGGRLGILFVAVEKRFKASVHYVAGLKFQRALPEADPINYASRVKIPVLMLNGRYDNFFPLETSQIPLFRLLGTSPQEKRHVVYETGHYVPRVQLIQEVLDWLDRYLGPVHKTSLP